MQAYDCIVCVRSLLEKDITLNEDRLKTVIQTTIENINATIRELRHLFLVEDVVDTIKVRICPPVTGPVLDNYDSSEKY